MFSENYLNKKIPILCNTEYFNKTEYDIDIDGIIDFFNDYDDKLKKIDLSKWYYNNSKIEYKYNDFGYRSDNLNLIEYNDYVLTFGCSYSFGMGLFYEDTYSYKLAKELNLKNINLSVPGSGIDFHKLNTILFTNFFTKKKLPKMVIYQYPNDYRVRFSEVVDGSLRLFTDSGVDSDNTFDNYQYLSDYWINKKGEKYVQDLTTPLLLNNIWKFLGVPVFHITFDDYIQEYKSNYQEFEIYNIKDESTSLYELARDLSHNGVEFHNKVYEFILKKYKNG